MCTRLASVARLFWRNSATTPASDRPRNLVCHSWILGIERNLFLSWIERGSSHLAPAFASPAGQSFPQRSRVSGVSEILNLESTELIAATAIQDEQKEAS